MKLLHTSYNGNVGAFSVIHIIAVRKSTDNSHAIIDMWNGTWHSDEPYDVIIAKLEKMGAES